MHPIEQMTLEQIREMSDEHVRHILRFTEGVANADYATVQEARRCWAYGAFRRALARTSRPVEIKRKKSRE
jgi:hypothetical protein